MAGYKSQTSAAEKLNIERGSLKEIERVARGAQFKTVVELSELYRVPPSLLFPDYLLSSGANEHHHEMRAVSMSLTQLNLDDLRTIRVVAEALAERRRQEK